MPPFTALISVWASILPLAMDFSPLESLLAHLCFLTHSWYCEMNEYTYKIYLAMWTLFTLLYRKVTLEWFVQGQHNRLVIFFGCAECEHPSYVWEFPILWIAENQSMAFIRKAEIHISSVLFSMWHYKLKIPWTLNWEPETQQGSHEIIIWS